MLLNVSLKKLQLQGFYDTVSPRVVLVFSTQLGDISICTPEFSETMYNVCCTSNYLFS